MRHLLALPLLMATVMLCACGGPDGTDPDLSSETHWMRQCIDGEACGQGGQCVCGVCTLPCDNDNDCADAGPLSACVPTGQSATDLVCDGEALSTAGVCLAPCQGNEACDGVEGGLSCEIDHCVPKSGDLPRGCRGNEDCGTEDYCAIEEVGACLNPLTTGSCLPRPEDCVLIFAPVCGCDGATYGNSCQASAEGVNIAAEGECVVEDRECLGNEGCGQDEYCRFPREDACGLLLEFPGTCEVRPEACDLNFDPVCGCDGETHSNACMAANAGVNVSAAGECDDPQPRTCGGIGGLECEQVGDYCFYAPGDQCGAADQLGLCLPRPEACAQVLEPVCGCDGNTYSNSCFAATVGISVLHENECAQENTCLDNNECDNGQFCRFSAGACGANDIAGVCESVPQVCIEIVAPVCGCDNVTYNSECDANQQGQSVAQTGECE